MNLAFVLLREAKLPDATQVASTYTSYAADEHRLRTRPVPVETVEGDGVLEFQLGPGETALVALIPAPVPGGEAEAAAEFSVSALGTGWSLPPHAAHLIVTVKDDGDGAGQTVDSLARFTSLLGAIIEVTPAVGVYWGGAGATHDAAFFRAIARERDAGPRIMLWSGVSVARDPGGRLSLLSLGMRQLGLPDLLMTSGGSPQDALGFFFDLLTYVVERGEALPDGDSIGRDENEKLTVRYVASPIDAATKVWRIDLE